MGSCAAVFPLSVSNIAASPVYIADRYLPDGDSAIPKGADGNCAVFSA